MLVYLDQKEIQVFRGARLMDALLAFSPKLFDKVVNGDCLILDRFGNITELDGPLREGQKLFTQKTEL
ncbi:MAG: hypothetical protein IPH88_03400 [Bacteroidales bacterium]|nr:hypothetical protein [Bacteroidales bacterium]